MAELSLKERLQPSLLDRLTDDHPESKKEAWQHRVLSERKLRKSVLRDLSWLLNSSGLPSGVDLESHPLVAESTLNFGMPDLAGLSLSGLDITKVEERLKDVIMHFEPRISRESLNIHAVRQEKDEMSHNALVFEIQGDLWAHPMPLHVLLKTELDLESGDVKVTEHSG